LNRLRLRCTDCCEREIRLVGRLTREDHVKPTKLR
jgi:hypothetical protein